MRQERSESARELRTALYKSDQQQLSGIRAGQEIEEISSLLYRHMGEPHDFEESEQVRRLKEALQNARDDLK